MKISDLGKELGVASKEIIAFVNEKGIECKAATKNLSDEETEMVRKAFKKAAPANDKKDEKPKAESKKKEESPKSEPVKKEEKEKPAKAEKKQEVKEAPAQQAEVKKQPKFNFKINPQFVNTPQQGQKRPNQGNVPNQSPQLRPLSQGPTRLIKPTTPPSAAPSVNFVNPHSAQPKPVKNTPETAPVEKPAVQEAPEQVQASPKQEVKKENKPQVQEQNVQKEQKRGNTPFNKGGFEKPFNQDNRFAPKNAPKFADAPQAPSNEKRKDDKRRGSQEKDKKKNSYEDRYEDGMGQKGKTLKPGAFIKPEKKVETVEDDIKVLVLPEVLTIRDLTDKMKLQPSTIVKKLLLAGEIVPVNTEITFEKAEEIAMEYDILCEKEEKVDVIEELLKEED